MIHELARAKVNLTLHVGRQIEDRSDAFYRYHPLDSLVVFADIGDMVTAEPAKETSLRIAGPFSEGLANTFDNLILKTYRAVQCYDAMPHLAFKLEKNLPVSAGLGGGSANAAATLRILKSFVDMPEASWRRIALGLGADVPICLQSCTSRMTGIGESVTPIQGLGMISAVFVNPRVAVSTQDVFRAYDSENRPEAPDPQSHYGGLLDRAKHGTNNLQPTSENLAPVISDVIRALDFRQGCQLARMTGSGATCFGLFENQDTALAAAAYIQHNHAGWWCTPTQLGDLV